MSKVQSSKPNLDFCAEQIGRMSGLEYAGALDFMAVQELAVTLRDISETEEHAKRIVTRYLREGGYVDDQNRRVHKIPTPYQLAEFSKGLVVDPVLEMQSGGLPPGCDACGWSGWRVVTRLRFDPISRRDVEFTGSGRCTCPRGQRLTEMDKSRTSAAAAQ